MFRFWSERKVRCAMRVFTVAVLILEMSFFQGLARAQRIPSELVGLDEAPIIDLRTGGAQAPYMGDNPIIQRLSQAQESGEDDRAGIEIGLIPNEPLDVSRVRGVFLFDEHVVLATQGGSLRALVEAEDGSFVMASFCDRFPWFCRQ